MEGKEEGRDGKGGRKGEGGREEVREEKRTGLYYLLEVHHQFMGTAVTLLIFPLNLVGSLKEVDHSVTPKR